MRVSGFSIDKSFDETFECETSRIQAKNIPSQLMPVSVGIYTKLLPYIVTQMEINNVCRCLQETSTQIETWNYQ